MNTNLVPFVVGWAVIAIIVCVFAIWRKLVSRHEDDMLHIGDGATDLVAQQNQVANKLLFIDRWGKIFTVIAFVYGLVLATAYVYASWVARNAASAEVELLTR
ncbi:MAG: hypothetical protein FJW20_01680 [Acidimicrobiia bacterium]|nr:hypothetical protein [Acidimicrobiia bacterium]